MKLARLALTTLIVTTSMGTSTLGCASIAPRLPAPMTGDVAAGGSLVVAGAAGIPGTSVPAPSYALAGALGHGQLRLLNVKPWSIEVDVAGGAGASRLASGETLPYAGALVGGRAWRTLDDTGFTAGFDLSFATIAELSDEPTVIAQPEMRMLFAFKATDMLTIGARPGLAMQLNSPIDVAVAPFWSVPVAVVVDVDAWRIGGELGLVGWFHPVPLAVGAHAGLQVTHSF